MFLKSLIDIVKSIGYLVIFPFEALLTVIIKIIKLVPKKNNNRGGIHIDLSKIHTFTSREILLFVTFLGLFIFLVIPLMIYLWFKEIPNLDLFSITSQNYGSTKIYDRKGQLLYEIYADKNYQHVSLDQIPTQAVNATLAVEDSTFYYHNGVRIDSIFRSVGEIFFKHNLQGGSTITQQLVKNVLLTPERTVQRKIKEVVLALIVEKRYTKQQILELYLNNISYGGNAWGIQSAAEKYFHKNVWELDLAESTMLAGLPSAPTAYSPFSNLDMAKERQKYVLDRMVTLKYITQADADSAYAEDLVFAPQTDTIKAPHFVDYVRNKLEQEYGKQYVDTAGLSVYTTLDLDLQQKVEQIVSDEVTKGAKYNFTNGAAVVIDPKTGDILAYVGSVDYFKENWGSFDVASALRQPGSSIKVVTYALALSKGYTAASVINDSPITYQSVGSKPYTPVNYDGKYHGDVSLRTALANSYNIPAVKLAKALGPDNIAQLGKDMGLTNWAVDGKYGLSITLGGREVRLLDLDNVYATVARGGLYKNTNAILAIKDGHSEEIYNSHADPDVTATNRVLSPEVSYLLWNILSDNNARTPAFGTYNQLNIPGYTVAVKTGTTDNKKDNWTFGFTPSYAVGVWVGNNDGQVMNPYLASGVTGAAPIWNRIMRAVLTGTTNEIEPMPNDVFVKKDAKCNKSEVFVKGSNIPSTLCIDDKKDSKDKKKRNN